MWQTWSAPGRAKRGSKNLDKAMHEVKTRTPGTERRAGYESAVLGLANAGARRPEVTAAIAGFVAKIGAGRPVNNLGAKVVQPTMPGVADLYQGCELTRLSLVDRQPHASRFQRRRAAAGRARGGPDRRRLRRCRSRS